MKKIYKKVSALVRTNRSFRLFIIVAVIILITIQIWILIPEKALNEDIIPHIGTNKEQVTSSFSSLKQLSNKEDEFEYELLNGDLKERWSFIFYNGYVWTANYNAYYNGQNALEKMEEKLNAIYDLLEKNKFVSNQTKEDRDWKIQGYRNLLDSKTASLTIVTSEENNYFLFSIYDLDRIFR